VNIVFFDGVCVLCNSFADLLLRLDSRQSLSFATLQGRAAKKHLGARAKALNTLFYVRLRDRQRHVLQQSDAVLGIFQDLSYPWRMLSWLRLLPRGLRDAAYQAVVRSRYRVFGRRQACRLPSPAERRRFLT
jgi:predicted DCC family thiol-disulfide oxidoreductase YuxK